MGRRLKCRWCGFSIPAWFTTKSGKIRSGWSRLTAHQEDEHFDEVEALRINLNVFEMFGESL